MSQNDTTENYEPFTINQNMLSEQCSQCLQRSASSNNDSIEILKLCNSKSSTNIEEVQQISEDRSVNLLMEHSERYETNPTCHCNVRGDMVLRSNRDQFEIGLDEMKNNRAKGCREEARKNCEELKISKQKSLSLPRTSIDVENISSNGSNQDAQSEETEDIEH